ncbi:MAG: c-type cytochrome [Planctomycetes bacterium]|nr:c-type cytochrome [Planctomycetota bacterium]
MRNPQAIVSIGLVSLAALILLVGWFAADPADVEPVAAEQAFDRGLAEAYVKAGCWQCHSVETLRDQLNAEFGAGAGGHLPVGPDLSGIALQGHPDWHVAHFWDPAAVVAGSQMPAQRQLFEGEQLNARGRDVIKFLMTLDAPSPLRAPWPVGNHEAQAGDAGRGKTLFRQHCAGCHGDAGNGDGPAARWFVATRPPAKLAQGEAYRISGDARQAVFDTLSNGLPGTGMPSFFRLSVQDRADLTEYTVKLLGK